MADESDHALFQRFAEGEAQAFDALFRRYAKPVFRLCVQIVGAPSQAEELAQEVFVKVHQSATRYRPTGSFRGWLFRIARNHCLNAIRRRKARLRLVSVEVAEQAGALPAQRAHQLATVQSKALQRDIATSLAELPESQRTAFILLRFEGMSYVEIADAMQITIPAVKGLLNRAKRHLMLALSAYLDEEIP